MVERGVVIARGRLATHSMYIESRRTHTRTELFNVHVVNTVHRSNGEKKNKSNVQGPRESERRAPPLLPYHLVYLASRRSLLYSSIFIHAMRSILDVRPVREKKKKDPDEGDGRTDRSATGATIVIHHDSCLDRK